MSKTITNPVHLLEIQEVIKKLRENGYGELVDCLLDNENAVYTKKGRLNKSSTCRRLGWKTKQLEDALKTIRELLHNDFE
jgi:hypothetical protein